MNIFNYDNPVMTAIRKIVNMISVSAMWVIFSLPIFTFGASTTALYYSVQKNLKYDRGYAATEFWHAFKDNFKQATLVWLILLFSALFFLYDYWIMGGIAEEHTFLRATQVFFIVLLVLEVIYIFLIFPYMARFKNTTKGTFKNTAILAVRHFPVTLVTALILLAGGLIVAIMPVSVVIIPALVMWQNSFFLEKMYRLYMTEEEKEAEDFRNKKDYN